MPYLKYSTPVRAAEEDVTVQAFVEDLIDRELDSRRVR